MCEMKTKFVIMVTGLLVFSCIEPENASGVKVMNSITLETGGYCRDLDFRDSVLVAATDEMGYAVFNFKIENGEFSSTKIYGLETGQSPENGLQGGGVLIPDTLDYFLLMDQFDALYYINFSDVDSVGRFPYPGSENRDYIRGFVTAKSTEDSLVIYTLNRSEDGNSTFLSIRKAIPIYNSSTNKIDIFFAEFNQIEILNSDAQSLFYADSIFTGNNGMVTVANSQLGILAFQESSDGELIESAFSAFDTPLSGAVETVYSSGKTIFAGQTNDDGCYVVQLSDSGTVAQSVQLAEGYSVKGIHLEDGILALACGSDGVLLYEWSGFGEGTVFSEMGRLDSDYAYNVKIYDHETIFAATRSGVQVFQIGR